ncbi:AMP-binding protein [Novosphingobium sp. G106]|uniref:AMP-binding protein n=1 Tax=Novosphingobium sp. G106 TaxID=2849500 RepID=UPI001C2D4F66|nr:AMP-binding protein [Novosphingobium sp. G106]MBV1688743.1 AMP-binding protein [Novosphingobium sp. G106]
MTSEVPPSTIPAMLAGLVARCGQHDAIATEAEAVSYAELNERSARMARALLAAGAGKGARIALLAPDGIFWATAFLAALRIGGLITCVSTMVTPKEFAHILRNSDTQILLSARRFLSHDYAKTIEAAFPALTGSGPGKLLLEDAPFLRSVWLDDADGAPWAGSIGDLLARADAVTPALLSAVEAQVTPGDEAVIVYTSGSTSLPKAVVHTQWNITRHPP